jgi:cellulose synthase/poly-beta-1,6-N-acetylglucosamine synthase-like glycosyltransferase
MTEVLAIGAKWAFWLSCFALSYIYFGYLPLLRLIRRLRRPVPAVPGANRAGALPRITVLLTVHNEEARIQERIRNLLACDYPRDRLEILVASDGSTDRTEDLVAGLAAEAPVRLFSTGGRLGKTETQNRAVGVATGDIIAFTDAETTFAASYMKALASAFADARVGAVTAHLLFGSSGSGVSRGQGYYWDYELKLRQLESELGWLAVASGQAMAVRRSLLRPMDPSIGEDCIVPLDVVMQGRLVVHQVDAVAHDRLESEPEREFKTRVRMTLRNWLGTWSRPELLNPLRHPGYAFALWSHKVLRWLSPWFLAVLTVSVCLLSMEPLYGVLALLALLFYASALLGWTLDRAGRRLGFPNTAFAFVLANAGLLVGTCKALAGQRIVTYTSGTLEKQRTR